MRLYDKVIMYYIYLKVRATKMDLNVERRYSMKEICEYLGVSRDAVLAWIEKREMPATKIGKLWKFKIGEVCFNMTESISSKAFNLCSSIMCSVISPPQRRISSMRPLR